MNLELKKLKKSIYMVIIALLLAVVVLFWVMSRSFVTILLNPKDASISIDGKSIRPTSSGQIQTNFTPGPHLVRVESDGYTGFSEEINFSRGFAKKINITLSKTESPVVINDDGDFLTRGIDFNDGFYLGNGGKTIYKLKVGFGEQGQIKALENKPVTEARLSGAKEIVWSPSKELALLRKNDGSINLFDFMKYDFVHQTETPWGKDIGAIAWSPDNSKIAYIYSPASGEKSLVFSNILNTEIERVVNLKEHDIDDPILHWSPDSEHLMIIPRSKEKEKNNVYLFNAYTRSMSKLTETGNLVDAAFSPDSNSIIYSTLVGSDSHLSIMNKDGSDQQDLKLTATINNITWAKDSRNIVVAGRDSSTTSGTKIFKFDTKLKQTAGFVINDLLVKSINSISISDDGKILLYGADKAIYALKIN